jgi:predicted metalloprotease
MESRKENCGEKRRRKMISRPVLVRSEKPGQVMSASYMRQRPDSMAPLWKAA